MKIAAAQIKSIAGDVDANIQRHISMIERAAEKGVQAIFFPELSLTGYEPTLAKSLATRADDVRFDVFASLADEHAMTVGVGMPLLENAGITISMMLFQPGKVVKVCSKKYLHCDEDPYFVPGENLSSVMIQDCRVALAICYEISVEAHEREVFRQDVAVYLASVAKSVSGIEKSHERLSTIASMHQIPVVMSNCIGHADGFECAGRSAAWNTEGVRLAQMGNLDEGLLVLDVVKQRASVI